MTDTRTVALTLAVHVDKPGARAIRVSETGEDKDAEWLPRSCITKIELTGKTTRGFNRYEQAVDVPLAIIEVAEWKAKQAGWI